MIYIVYKDKHKKLMIKTFLQYQIFDICINTFFSGLTASFPSVEFADYPSGTIYKLDGEYFYIDDETNDESYFDFESRCWRLTDNNLRNPYLDCGLYDLCLDSDLEDIVGEDDPVSENILYGFS